VVSSIVTLFVAFAAGWGALALRYQAPGGRAVRTLCASLWVALSLACIAGLWTGAAAIAVLGYALAYTGLLLWWRHLPPSNERAWADDVARMVEGTVNGHRVTLRNVRNFEWRSPTDYTPRWETRSYDLQRLDSVDVIVSYWTGRWIAHMLISFGFDDGSRVVFSVEIRRETSESFSEIGGFFKEFELSIIAADERDIVLLRTNARREDTYLFRLAISTEAGRALFLAYVEEANSLVRAPRFYHTISGNCTTLVYCKLRRILGRLPFSYRVLLSGYLPEYLYDVRLLDRRYRLAELRALGYISERARRSGDSAGFSADIRQGVPGSLPGQ
jgi:hypothetical protein